MPTTTQMNTPMFTRSECPAVVEPKAVCPDSRSAEQCDLVVLSIPAADRLDTQTLTAYVEMDASTRAAIRECEGM